VSFFAKWSIDREVLEKFIKLASSKRFSVPTSFFTSSLPKIKTHDQQLEFSNSLRKVNRITSKNLAVKIRANNVSGDDSSYLSAGQKTF